MQESLCPCAFVRACVCVCGCVYIFSPFKCKQTGCKTFCFSLNYHLKKSQTCPRTQSIHAHSQRQHTHTHGARSRPCTASISVKLRIKLPVNLARFPCQKQPLCECFSFAGFTRLFLSRPAVSP